MRVWIFDLDGVVTSLTEKKITNPKLLPFFAQFLAQNEPVTINTGRSLAFIRNEVMTPLRSYLNEHHLPQTLLHNFFAVGEKGNAWLANEEKDCFDLSAAIPKEFVKNVQQLIERDYKDSMFFDTTKRTMISLEMHTGLSLEQFAPAKQKLVPILQNMLTASGLAKEFKLDPSVSAIDIEHIGAGKAKGAKHILDWLSKNRLHPLSFVAFGDSQADIGTGSILQQTGIPFTFVFVGNPHLLKENPSFPVVYTQQHYDEGVIEFLKEHA